MIFDVEDNLLFHDKLTGTEEQFIVCRKGLDFTAVAKRSAEEVDVRAVSVRCKYV